MLDTRLLHYFMAVADEGNISKAAYKVCTTQSNLSKQIADLEEQLGKKLFIRGPRKTILTEEGLLFRKRAMEILALMEQAERDVKDFEEDVSGIVHVGAVESNILEHFAMPMLHIKRNFPKVLFKFFSGSIAELQQKMADNSLEFAIMVAPIDMSRYNYVKLPFTNRFGLLMKSDCPLALKKRIRAKDVERVPLWVAYQQSESNNLAGWLGNRIDTLNVVAQFNLITNVAYMVKGGFGAAFTFENLVDCGDESEICFRPLEPKVEAEFYFVWNKGRRLSKPAEIFLKQITEEML